MTLELYDEAVERKLKKLFPNVIGASPNEAMWSSNKNGKVELPLVSFYRINNPIDWSSYNNAELFGTKGYTRSYNDDDNSIGKTLSISVTLTYQIDLWAADRKTSDQLFQDMVFALILHPNIQLDMKGTEKDKVFSLRLLDSQNSTDIPSFARNNRIYRYTMTYQVNEARLMYQYNDKYPVKEIPITPTVPNDPGIIPGKNSDSNFYSPGVRIIVKDGNTGETVNVYDSDSDSQTGYIDVYPNKVTDNTRYEDDTDTLG